MKRALAPRTAERYAMELDLFERFLTEREGQPADRLYLDVLNRQLLAELWEWLAIGLHGNPRSVAQKRKIIEGVQRWWRWCWEQDELEEWTPKPRRLRMPSVDRKPTVAPTWAECDLVLAGIQSWRWRLGVIMRFTGLRVNQVMRLEWSDVDLGAALLIVRPELGKTRSEKAGRVVPISPHLVELLAGWGTREGWLVETGPRVTDRSRAARAEMMRRWWRRAGVREEVWKGRPQHAFRKCFRTELEAAGAKASAVEYLIGHDLGLAGVYTDPRALDLVAAVDLVPALGATTEDAKEIDLRAARARRR